MYIYMYIYIYIHRATVASIIIRMYSLTKCLHHILFILILIVLLILLFVIRILSSFGARPFRFLVNLVR